MERSEKALHINVQEQTWQCVQKFKIHTNDDTYWRCFGFRLTCRFDAIGKLRFFFGTANEQEPTGQAIGRGEVGPILTRS
jgi:hypothetical protein